MNSPQESLPGTPTLPQHVAIIMDGNGRWAAQRSLPRTAGHRAGVKAVRACIEHAIGRGIPTLTLFAFSSENWRRPQEEVSLLMQLFLEALDREVEGLGKNGVRLHFIGAREKLAAALQERMAAAEQGTQSGSRLLLVIAVAYGGRDDLVQAAGQLAREAATGKLDPAEIDERRLAACLQTRGLAEPDLLIRTGGERRISNFLLWSLAYTELHFTDVLWPDFDSAAFDAALDDYQGRQRRYGRTSPQLEASTC